MKRTKKDHLFFLSAWSQLGGSRHWPHYLYKTSLRECQVLRQFKDDHNNMACGINHSTSTEVSYNTWPYPNPLVRGFEVFIYKETLEDGYFQILKKSH